MAYTLIIVSETPYEPGKLAKGVEYINVLSAAKTADKQYLDVFKILKDVKTPYMLICEPGDTYPSDVPENGSEELLYGNYVAKTADGFLSTDLGAASADGLVIQPSRIQRAFVRKDFFRQALMKVIGRPSIHPFYVACYLAVVRGKARFVPSLVIAVGAPRNPNAPESIEEDSHTRVAMKSILSR